jgi:hypothetical protein
MTWMLQTNADPLATARRFLHNLWLICNLDGMLLPVYLPGKMRLQLALIEDPGQLADADPFVPFMQMNAGELVAQLVHQYPGRRLAAVLRGCEARLLGKIAKHEMLDLESWVIIGVDCLACFPTQDLDWRVEKAGSLEHLTRQVLRNARQGGIALSRFQLRCQMCSNPVPRQVDLCLALIGLAVKQTMLVIPREEDGSIRLQLQDLHLQEITDGPAVEQDIAQRLRVLAAINQRRQQFREKMAQVLPGNSAEDDDQDEAFHHTLSLEGCGNAYSRSH